MDFAGTPEEKKVNIIKDIKDFENKGGQPKRPINVTFGTGIPKVTPCYGADIGKKW
jgi:hypothetical protein